jgi:hypothetical protein
MMEEDHIVEILRYPRNPVLEQIPRLPLAKAVVF